MGGNREVVVKIQLSICTLHTILVNPIRGKPQNFTILITQIGSRRVNVRCTLGDQDVHQKACNTGRPKHPYSKCYRTKMNRLISLHITDSVYILSMLSTDLSYADNSEAVDCETDDDKGAPLLIINAKHCPLKNNERGKIFF